MTPKKLSIMFCFPAYGGNGGIASEVPNIRQWYSQLLLRLRDDPRVDHVMEKTISDTPITMVRNKFVTEARAMGADVVVMVDSDMHPDLHVKETDCKPFWESSFDFLYNHWDRGPCVIGAPYCGPPGSFGAENVYVFDWQNYGDHGTESVLSLEAIPRMMAAKLRGIQPAGALPTGLIMYDIRAFDLIEPSAKRKEEVLDDLIEGRITKTEALNLLHDGFFYYQWKNQYADEKISTEDVTNTRDISLAGMLKLGYNPIYCNWDAPAGHWKPWCVRGRPLPYDARDVAESFRLACQNPVAPDEVIMDAADIIAQGARGHV